MDKVNNLGKDSNVTHDEVNQLKLQLKDIKEQVSLPSHIFYKASIIITCTSLRVDPLSRWTKDLRIN